MTAAHPYNRNSFSDSGKHLSNSCEYGSCNRIIEAKIVRKEMKNGSPDKFILGHLNINLLRNKFDFLKNAIGRNVDIVLISETKLYDSFPLA